MSEFGDVIVHRNEDGSPEIVRADPRICVSTELLEVAAVGTEWLALDGDLLTIRDKRQSLTYRLMGYVVHGNRLAVRR